MSLTTLEGEIIQIDVIDGVISINETDMTVKVFDGSIREATVSDREQD